MFETIINWLLKANEQKTELEEAISKISKQQIICNLGLSDLDVFNGTSFKIGQVKRYKGFVKFDHMTVYFKHNNKEVIIKYNDEIVFYFNNEEETKAIRQAITDTHIKINQKEKQKTINEFNEL